MDNPYAFPSEVSDQSGMTLRDYFAGQALIGLLSRGSSFFERSFVDLAIKESKKEKCDPSDILALLSYDLASSMLKIRLEEREKWDK